jgi:hypothetical protein
MRTSPLIMGGRRAATWAGAVLAVVAVSGCFPCEGVLVAFPDNPLVVGGVWNGEATSSQLPTLELRLELDVEYVSARSYDVTGTVVIDGARLLDVLGAGTGSASSASSRSRAWCGPLPLLRRRGSRRPCTTLTARAPAASSPTASSGPMGTTTRWRASCCSTKRGKSGVTASWSSGSERGCGTKPGTGARNATTAIIAAREEAWITVGAATTANLSDLGHPRGSGRRSALLRRTAARTTPSVLDGGFRLGLAYDDEPIDGGSAICRS